MKRPSAEQMATAVEWLRCYDGTGEGGTNEQDCKAIADWLEHQISNTLLRAAAKSAAVPVSWLRVRIKEKRNGCP